MPCWRPAGPGGSSSGATGAGCSSPPTPGCGSPWPERHTPRAATHRTLNLFGSDAYRVKPDSGIVPTNVLLRNEALRHAANGWLLTGIGRCTVDLGQPQGCRVRSVSGLVALPWTRWRARLASFSV